MTARIASEPLLLLTVHYALVLSPKHGQASFYLQKAKQNLDEEIESHFLKAAREVSALKYSQAAVSYCSVVRLLGKNINDTDYKTLKIVLPSWKRKWDYKR